MQKRGERTLPEHLKLTLITGGARSGKSAHAERMVSVHPPPWLYIATAEALDSEMADRIAVHKQRRGPEWECLEIPLDLTDALENIPPETIVLVDCLTMWLSNQLLAGNDVRGEIDRLVSVLERCKAKIVMVSNEVGQGIVPEHRLARTFRDMAGQLNQRIASISGGVFLMVAGIPVKVK